jgi:hypothetical protein
MTAKKAKSDTEMKKAASVWLDENAEMPVITEKARHLESFLSAIADGKVDEKEIKAQQARVVKLMKAVEPQLDEKLHAQVTELICEVVALDLMQMLHSMQAARPMSVFRG